MKLFKTTYFCVKFIFFLFFNSWDARAPIMCTLPPYLRRPCNHNRSNKCAIEGPTSTQNASSVLIKDCARNIERDLHYSRQAN